MARLALLPAIGLLAVAWPAAAADLEFFTGQSLYAQCSAKAGEADQVARNARCAGYVIGVSDAQQAGAHQPRSRHSCRFGRSAPRVLSLP